MQGKCLHSWIIFPAQSCLFVCSAQIFSVLLWEPHLSVLSSDSGSVLEDHVVLKIKSGPPTQQACAQPSESSSEPSAYLGGG